MLIRRSFLGLDKDLVEKYLIKCRSDSVNTMQADCEDYLKKEDHGSGMSSVIPARAVISSMESYLRP